jgi:hypothetical protein
VPKSKDETAARLSIRCGICSQVHGEGLPPLESLIACNMSCAAAAKKTLCFRRQPLEYLNQARMKLSVQFYSSNQRHKKSSRTEE